ncbi:asparagine synthase (glutamine-hydrolyzing) [Butyrivibrio sp. CB08]|uniref:asparagine synthase (glutamine-hydrolyzing) n=1 Tax=Butyrivibrio sp. CB08 TaxID=2364879 RepID=UPI000EA9FE11|nr:asparagine synthase (glutamine-hydrolyzing) [Butyrivibrio sp. CB08]RKM60408.1 asparagine synthase (glutamine-hydrolyzing) [Butyrivibrio sp. CB08]
MCGICGLYSKKDIDKDTLIRMSDTMIHRGPDDSGATEVELVNEGWSVGLAHRRLAILDLTKAGHQPMATQNQDLTVVFNGEIYNFKEIKKELSDYQFATNCDTEVILAAYLKWGISCVDRFNGMFAFALFDKRTDTLFLARDRMGKKPLFYWVQQDLLVFSSELKGIYAFPGFNEKIRKDVLGDYFMHRSIHAPSTIYENVYCLEPGTILSYDKGVCVQNTFWSVADTYSRCANRFKGTLDDAIGAVDETLHRAIKRRLIADVEVGAFLSGGIDSSLICAIANQHLSTPVKSFCIGFEDEKINEAVYAKEIANYLGCAHEERYITDDEMFSLVGDIPTYYDQPVADPAEIPLMLLSAMTRQSVKVALSGDGGDELFGGYAVYRKLILAQKKKCLGRMIYALKQVPGIKHNKKLNSLPIEYRMVSCKPNPKIETQMGVDAYTNILDKILADSGEYYYQFDDVYGEENLAQRRMLLDMDTSLPDYMLVKADRATMRSSLECRCPYLDTELIELAFSLPLEYKIDSNSGKLVLKELAYRYIPKQFLDRPKAGFAVPLDRWLRGPLKEQIMDWTSYDYLLRQGIFNPEETIKFVSEYMQNGDQGRWSGKNFSKLIWPYYVFQQWYDRYEGMAY